ncbi:Conserved_hypothetical protein [Hexamita inflata]|uniref:Uncharacterized protein n=1 Tax=Hexamita inflata TaxID=28002 RepID=A0AA86RF66_9EUKA|nr:Conserved hypothetical protein [Hexamita inflata]CAI9939779.1 Conserved hypothetical protein [Hexamita inflata]CAI9940872.1 Conserved hypothetical protein [Hexamita inflata]CAI9972153.1 Conserved hypothetical protein [Hexamita inflata]
MSLSATYDPQTQLTLESDDQIRARCLFITQLQQHIEKCEREQNYIEAERCKKRLLELCEQDRRGRVLRLKERHRAECDQLEQVMKEESIEREEAWKNKSEQFELKAAEDLQAIRQKQAERRTMEEQHILSKMDINIVRPSKQLQDFRRTQQMLVKQGKYKEADVFRIKADALEQLEIQRRDQENQTSLIRQLQNVDKKLDVELSTSIARLKTQRAQLKEAQVQDFDRIQKKQENIRKQLQQSQTQELMRLRKSPTGLPFIVDEEGNDLLSTPDGLQELMRIIKETQMTQKRVEPKSMAKAYIDGLLTVKPGDGYYSVKMDPHQEIQVETTQTGVVE